MVFHRDVPGGESIVPSTRSGSCKAIRSSFDGRSALLGLASLLLVALAPLPSHAAQVVRTFYVEGAANRCIDAGPPAQRAVGRSLVLALCDRSDTQRIDVQEMPGGVVTLQASGLCIGPRAQTRQLNAPLELQTCAPGSASQQFMLDGDSIIDLQLPDGKSPETGRLVVEAQGGRVAPRTPVILGARELESWEFWRLTPAFDPGAVPTSGFTTVRSEAELRAALAVATPGAVIQLGADIDLNPSTMTQSMEVGSGVTIRGGRRGLQPGFAITYPPDFSIRIPVFTLRGEDIRITGLRVRGPSTRRDPDQIEFSGIVIVGNLSNARWSSRTILDHNEMSGFTNAAIRASSEGGSATGFCPASPRSKEPRIQVLRNYLHDNAKQGAGYGVEVSGGNSVLIRANTFSNNRHAIAATFDPRNDYYAYDNLVLPPAPRQESTFLSVLSAAYSVLFPGVDLLADILFGIRVPDSWFTHDFDVHGSGPGNTYDFEDGFVPAHSGGNAGNNFDIGWNSFLGGNRENLDLRGTPCLGATFHDNVTQRSQDDSLTDRSNGNVLNVFSNMFSSADPLQQRMGSGDFDGDGSIDTFMATGAGWYYRPASQLEWRLLRRSTARIDTLQLIDVDGDGRTDARFQIGFQIFASWGASSPNELIGEIPQPAPPKPPREPTPPSCRPPRKNCQEP
jgi:hypothetical protein